jgi:biopolymer transport protein ExbB/TolQ
MIVERLLRVALAGSTWVLWLLALLSVLSFSAMLERWLFFRKHKDDLGALRSGASEALLRGDLPSAERVLARSRSLEARIVLSALRFRAGGPEAVSDAVESELGATRKSLEKGTVLLGTLGNNAPFVGLFGTVLGVIEAFHHLAGGPAKAAMGNVMSGIAEALVATGVGLFVALPAVIAFNIAQKRIAEIETDTVSLAKLVTAALRAAPPIAAATSAEAE